MEPNLSQRSKPYLDHVEAWLENLPVLSAAALLAEPERAAITAVDIINGFIRFGSLASPRVERIIPNVVRIMQAAWGLGVRNILHATDRHEPDAVEFNAFLPHCVQGTAEAEPVDELKALPFAGSILNIPKNTIASGMQTELEDWVLVHPEVDTFIVVGDVTDLCVYQLAMYLRLDANARNLQRRVIVPENCVQTYDYPAAAAETQGGFAHDGDLLHAVFLHHMALNGIEVVRDIV